MFLPKKYLVGKTSASTGNSEGAAVCACMCVRVCMCMCVCACMCVCVWCAETVMVLFHIHKISVFLMTA